MVKESAVLEVEGLRILGQLYLDGKGDQTPYPTVCLCHGIPAKNPVPGDEGYPMLAERICRHGFAVFIFNFRGTGFSGGNFDILGWTRDLKAVIDYLWTLPAVDRTHLTLLGFSGGAAVSIYLASQDRRISSVITCACPAEFTRFIGADNPLPLIDHFRSIGIIRDEGFPTSVDEWLDSFKLVSPIRYVAGIAPRPLLLVHGGKDEVVDASHANRLYQMAGEPKQLIIVDGAGHRLRRNDKAIAVIIDWLKSHHIQ